MTDSTAEDICRDIAEVLFVDVTDLDIDADLFSLGLDSIGLHTLIVRWRQQGTTADYHQLITAPTVRSWATSLGLASTDDA